KPQERNRIWRGSGYSFLHSTSNEIDSFSRVARPIEHFFHLLQRCVVAPVPRDILHNLRSLLSCVIDIFRRGLSHDFKSIEKIQFGAHILRLEKRSGNCGHAPPLPDPAFNDGSRYVICAHVPHGLNEGVDSIRASHSPRTDFTEDFGLILAKVRRTYLVPGRVMDNVEAE